MKAFVKQLLTDEGAQCTMMNMANLISAGKWLVLACALMGCSAAAEGPSAADVECAAYEACASQYTASVACLNGACACTIAASGESVFHQCQSGEPDGIYNKSLGLPRK